MRFLLRFAFILTAASATGDVLSAQESSGGLPVMPLPAERQNTSGSSALPAAGADQESTAESLESSGLPAERDITADPVPILPPVIYDEVKTGRYKPTFFPPPPPPPPPPDLESLTEKEQEQMLENAGVSIPQDGCTSVKEVMFEGETVLSSSVKDRVRSELLYRCFDGKLTDEQTVEITRFYISQAYPTARAYLSQSSNLAAGRIIIAVSEGRIAQITLNRNETLRDRLGVFTAFPLHEGNILYMPDIEQGLEQMNRMYSRKAAMQIKPGEKPGQSRIEVTSKDTQRFKTVIGTDNGGSEVYGYYPLKLRQTAENLLGLNEIVTLSHSANEKTFYDEYYSRSNSISLGLPLGYWDFSYSYTHSGYRREIKTIYRDYISHGETFSNVLSADRMLMRFTGGKLSASATLSYMNTSSYIDRTLVEVSSRKATTLFTQLNLLYFFRCGNFNASPGRKWGTGYFGAKEDPSDIRPWEPRSRFTLNTLSASVSCRFFSKFPVTYSAEGNIQQAEMSLYGTEQIGIGGLYSVRGFRKNSLADDSGYYIRNGLSINPLILNEKIPKELSLITGVHFDFGCVRNYYTGQNLCLSGTAASLRLSAFGFDFSATYAIPLTGTEHFTQKEKETFNASLNYTFFWDI